MTTPGITLYLNYIFLQKIIKKKISKFIFFKSVIKLPGQRRALELVVHTTILSLADFCQTKLQQSAFL